MGFQSLIPTGQIGPSSLLVGGQTSHVATQRRQITAAHAAMAKSWNLPHHPRTINPSADPWESNELLRESAPIDLRSFPTIHVLQIRGRTK